MKKYFLIVTLLVGLALPAQAKTINIVTTTTDLKWIAEYIAGNTVKVYSLGKGDQNYHFLQAKPSYMIKAKKADLFIRIGMDLEIGYEPLILEGARNPSIREGRERHLDASLGIEPLDVPDTVDRSMGDIHVEGNPHYWLDPLNMKIIASTIKDRLSKLFPENEPTYRDNLNQLNTEIDQKMQEWIEELAPFRGEKIISYHKTWAYFANRFGFKIIDTLEPKPGVPPSPSHLKNLIQIIKNQNVRFILLENIYKNDSAEYLAEHTPIKVVIAPISVGGHKQAKDYFNLMNTIIENIKQELSND